MNPRPILSAAETRAAEERLFAGGMSVQALMERAGHAVAEAAWRYAGGAATLILCGPGNNGGDGYVAARHLRERGVAVRVAAIGEPRTEAARAMRAAWDGPVEDPSSAAPAPLLVDALFGTGLTRPLDAAISERLGGLAAAAQWRLAVDLPSGVSTDDGAVLSPAPRCDITVALGALKPAHLLQPSARHCGRIVVADIGLSTDDKPSLVTVERPFLTAPGPDDHKYTRGYVAVVGGAMPGAATLAATAAQRAGAGYVMLANGSGGGPQALVRRIGPPAEVLADRRIGALLIGPGLGRDEAASAALDAALASGHRLVLDADALVLLAGGGLERLRHLAQPVVLTPHEGEFGTLFGDLPGSKVERARAAAARSGAVVLLKGADSVIAAPDGRAAIAWPAPGWLASAGTGDVLAGIVAAMLARGLPPFEAAQAAVWLNHAAAERAGPGLIADDIAQHLAALLGACA